MLYNELKKLNFIKNLENYGVQELNAKEVEAVSGGWTFLMPWELGYLFVDYYKDGRNSPTIYA